MPDSTATVSLASLVEDLRIYPRESTSSSHVSDLARALARGDILPPPTVDRATMRIVDGWHRTRAHLKVYGDDGQISVILRDYADESALLADAVELNTRHGRPLTMGEQTSSALMLQDAGLSREQISNAMHTTQERVSALLVRVVLVDDDSGTPMPRPARPVARPQRGAQGDLEPRHLTDKQYQVMRASSPYATLRTVRQLERELATNLIDLSKPNVVEAFWSLHRAIEKYVSFEE